TMAHDRRRTLCIVTCDQRGLHKGVASAEARRMFRIAFDLRWPSFMCLDENTARMAAESQRRSVVNRFARENFFRLTEIGHNSLWRLSRATSRSGQRNGCAHKFQKF